MNFETTAKAISHHRHTQRRMENGDGFTFLGSGAWRMAYLADDGFVYKVDSGNEDNENEFLVYMRALEMDLPSWIKIPAVMPVEVKCDCGTCPAVTVVNVMDRAEGVGYCRAEDMSAEDWANGNKVGEILHCYDMFPGYTNVLFDKETRSWWPVDMQMDKDNF